MTSPATDDLNYSVPWASSASDFFPMTTNEYKKRKVQRACDKCRQKKIRCNASGQLLPDGSSCSNCIISGSSCTFLKGSMKRGPPKAYVEGLEHRLATIEELVRKLALRVNIEAELTQYASEFPSFLSSRASNPLQPTSRSPQSFDSLGALASRATSHPTAYFYYDAGNGSEDSDTDDDDDDDPLPQRITKTLQEFNISETPSSFHGKSSGLGLVRAATLMKKEHGIQSTTNHKTHVLANAEWERQLLAAPPPSTYTFPPHDLIRVLFDLFFLHFTSFLPVIHQHAFEAQYRSGLHFKNKTFAKSVLLVCAIASRYCDDPRVCIEGIGPQSAGWQYFAQVRDLQPQPHTLPTLHDIQCYVMMSYFLQGTCAHRFSWTIIGTGIRLAQDMGMHRRKHGKGPISLQDEQEKRAFWCLLAIDRYMSSAIGRPLACQDEDFDLDFPVEVDDEYWSIPDHDGAPVTVPRQPTGVPSKISYFVASLKLYQILALVLRALYSIGKSKVFLGSDGENWDQRIVSELDSRMNQWFDTVPAHLKWDPDRQNAAHFMQSAILYTHYYHLQILIHRPFLRPTKGSSSLSFSSLSISTNAARSCIHVLEAVQNNGGRVPPPVLGSATHSGIVLLMAVWGARKTGVNVDSQTAMRDVKQCISFLKSCESRSQAARVLVDVLEDLANCGDLDLSHTPPSVKRGHSQSQDNLPIPPDASNTRLSNEAKGETPSSTAPQLADIIVLHQPDVCAMPALSQPSVSPVGESLMSPTTEFLQSYVASLPLQDLMSSSNPLHEDNPAQPSSVGVSLLGERAPISSAPVSTNLAPLANAPDGNSALDWDTLVKLRLQASSGTSSINGFAPLEGDPFTNSPRILSTSIEPFLRDADFLGYEGFGGTLEFAAEAQAFLRTSPEGPPLDNAEDIDWSNILNLG